MPGLEAGFRIDGIRIRPTEGLIDGPNGHVRVEPKAMAVLLELARNGGSVCSRDQLLAAVWPRGHITDDVLTRCIGQLRKALGDNPRASRYLETLSRRGYRLMLPIEYEPVAPVLLAQGTGEKLLVLPFQYLAKADDDYIADGLTELLTARLAQMQGLTVLSRTMAIQIGSTEATPTEFAAQTDVQWAVAGSVLRSDELLQVVVQLIDVSTDAHVWAATYLWDSGDELVFQNEIAREIALAIRLQLGLLPSLGPDAAPALSSAARLSVFQTSARPARRRIVAASR